MSVSSEQLLYISGQEVRLICQDIDALALVSDVFRLHAAHQTIVPDEAYLTWTTQCGEVVRSLNMPGYLGGAFQAAGTKIINSNPINVSRGLPRASGVTLLFDTRTVRVQCIMEGSYLSALRTASVSMLCISHLSDQDVSCLAVIGAGAIGKMHVELAVRTLSSLRRVALFDVNMSAAEQLASTLRTSFGNTIVIQVENNAEGAVRCSDAVILSTTVTKGYIPYGWLKPGSVVINVSLDDLLPEVFIRADLLFVDDWNLVKSDSRRLLGRMYREGKITGPHEADASKESRRVDGEVGDLVSGRHTGKNRKEDIVVVNPFGLAIEDVAFASRVFELARQRGLGTHLSV